VLLDRAHFRNDHAVVRRADRFDALDLDAGKGQPIRDLLRSLVDIDVIFKPTERCFHSAAWMTRRDGIALSRRMSK
jgi:hypothetical protein